MKNAPTKTFLMEGDKNLFVEKHFKNFHEDFLDELTQNIIEYQDISLIYDYIIGCFEFIESWNGFNYDENRRIIKNNYETTFLIRLKMNIENGIGNVKALMEIDRDAYPVGLHDIFTKVIANESSNVTEETKEYRPDFDVRFDYNKLKEECDLYSTNISKIKFINNRLYDLKEWQLKYDVNEFYGYIFTPMFYPNFVELCNLELERLNKELELEQKDQRKSNVKHITPVETSLHMPISETSLLSQFRWSASDTDLLELLAALHKSDSIQRRDGKPLTRKELVDYFQSIFGLEIKNMEVTLTKAGNRNNNTAFLDMLAQEFRNFVAGKEKKLTNRK